MGRETLHTNSERKARATIYIELLGGKKTGEIKEGRKMGDIGEISLWGIHKTRK